MTSKANKSPILSTTSAAEEYGCNRSYIKAEIKAGSLIAHQPSKAYVIMRQDFERWKASKRTKKENK